jgi:hypothetical protein
MAKEFPGGKRRNGKIREGRGDEPEGKHSKGAQTPKERMKARGAGGKVPKRQGRKFI